MTRAAWWRLAALWIGLAFALVAGSAGADTPVIMIKSWAGNVNFTGTQVTMRNKGNSTRNDPNSACSIVDPATQLKASISNIPQGATILSAQLYWAGSNSQANADYSVKFQGQQVSAESGRKYFSSTIGAGYDYFAGAADVTTLVKGNGEYTFSELKVNNGKPYCAVEGVVGGFSLLVVYSEKTEPFRVLNLYEGFQYFRYSGITLNLSNFEVPSPLPDTSSVRLGHITWEGDSTLQQSGEDLKFNNTEMTDGTFNPTGNQFNSKSNINGDSASYGIDFDAYTILPKSGIFKAGDKTATTRYQSGQDLVLLNAEIIAMPNVPTADLGMELKRNGELQVGRTTSYSLSASNAGPNRDDGPITVTVTLPKGLGYMSGTGSGWTCSPVGQTVTCKTDSALNKGAKTEPITLTVKPTATETYTVSAKVSGGEFDNLQGNNRATDSATASAAGALGFAFTDAACIAGVKIGEPGSNCKPFTGPAEAGTPVQVYVTTLGADQLPTPRSATADTAESLQFSFNCVNPGKTAGALASISGALPQPCSEVGVILDAASPLWSKSVALAFKANAPSAPVQFMYDDVGRVQLNLIDAASTRVSATFVVKPAKLVFSAVTRWDGAPNPADNGVTGFARAGEQFSLFVLARTATGKAALNFGYEGAQPGIVQENPPEQPNLPKIKAGEFTRLGGGAFKGTGFAWDEAGMLRLAPWVENYLNEGEVKGEYLNIGHFYPDHFTTEAVSTIPCMPKMACPSGTLASGEKVEVNGAVYSGQGFTVNITPVGMNGNALTNYKKPFATPISLAAFDKPGPGGVANPPGVANQPAMLGKGILTASKTDPEKGSAVSTTAKYALPGGFKTEPPRPIPAGPTAIYLRASATEMVASLPGPAGAASPPQPVEISSKLATGTEERGVVVVNGRLLLANAFGSELIKLPITATAQYWNGAAWDNNSADNTSDIGPAFAFSGCSGVLASAGATTPLSDNCKPLLKLMAGTVLRLEKGATRFWILPPGKGSTGSAWLQMGAGHPPWLPSTRARAVFGIYRSPLIYMREVY